MMNKSNEIKAHLINLEQNMMNHSTRHSIKELKLLIADEFIEFGSSGKIYNKEQVIDALMNEGTKTVSVSFSDIKLLSPEAALITYTTEIIKDKNERIFALRSSVWIKTGEGWQILFHQGTPLKIINKEETNV